jgi:SAM-dependent methyltransferase
LNFEGYQQTRLRKIAARCRGGTVLDIGYAHKPNSYLRGVYRVGLDLRGPVRPSGYEEEIVGDALDLPASLGTRRFDTIIAGELIEHLENPYTFLRSLRNFLTDDGRVIVSTPNPVAWPVIMFEWMGSRKFFYSHDHTYYFAPRWVRRMFESSGFVVDALVPVGLLLPLPAVALPCPVGFSYQVIYVARPARS